MYGDGSIRPWRRGISSGIRPSLATSTNRSGSGRSLGAFQTAWALRGHSLRIASPRPISSAREGRGANDWCFSGEDRGESPGGASRTVLMELLLRSFVWQLTTGLTNMLSVAARLNDS